MMQLSNREQNSAVTGYYNQESALLLQYPVITTNNFKQTVANYLLHVSKYNNSLPKLNTPIEEYNLLMEQANKTQKFNKVHVAIEVKNFCLWSKFQYGGGIINDKKYNELVVEYNQESEVKVPKKILKPLKQPAKDVFVAILSHAVGKLKQRNLQRMDAKESTQLHVSEGFLFSMTARSLKNQKVHQDDHSAVKLDYCDKTILNHLKRLMDADIVSSYKYHGYKIAKEISLNPSIMEFSEGSNNNHKHWLQTNLKKELPVIISYYSNLSKEKHNKAEIAKANCPDKEELEGLKRIRELIASDDSNSNGSDANASNYGNYRNNREQVNQQNEPRAEKEKKVAPKKEKVTIRESFQVLLDMDLYNAAYDLNAGKYNNYKPLPINHIDKEALRGTLNREQFATILMYDFIFTSAKLWKDRNVYVGEWINTIKYLETIFMRGGLHGFQYKTSQVNLIEQLRWRLKWAERFCKRNPDFKLLYPSMYFDVSRKASFEGGFRYTLKHYKRHVTSTENYAKKKRLYSGELTYKIRFKVLEYLNNKISFERLTDYVRRLEYRNHRQKNSLSYTLHNIIIVEREKIKHAQE